MRSVSNRLCSATVLQRLLLLLLVCIASSHCVRHEYRYSKDDLFQNLYERGVSGRHWSKRRRQTAADTNCPDKPLVVSPEMGVFAPRIFKYMFLMNIDQLALPYRHRAYLQNQTYDRLLDTFIDVSMPVLENIPKNCPSTGLVSVSDDNLVYDDVRVTMCKTTSICTEALKTNRYIVISPFVQYLDVVAKNIGRIKNQLKIRPKFITAAQRTVTKYEKHYREMNNIGEESVINYVGIHVRRRDHERSVKVFYGIDLVKAEYFLLAMDYFRERHSAVVFLVVSDDIQWAGANLLRRDDTFVVSQGGMIKCEYDLALLTQCNHTVLDYGNFGVVAYVLGRQGITVATDADKEVMQVFGTAPNWYFVKINENGSVAASFA